MLGSAGSVATLYFCTRTDSVKPRLLFSFFFISSLLPEDIHLTFITTIFSQYLYCIKSVDLNGTVLALLLLFILLVLMGKKEFLLLIKSYQRVSVYKYIY